MRLVGASPDLTYAVSVDRILVTLKYNELLVPTEGNYDFVFPTVVGPRYSCQVQPRSS